MFSGSIITMDCPALLLTSETWQLIVMEMKEYSCSMRLY